MMQSVLTPSFKRSKQFHIYNDYCSEADGLVWIILIYVAWNDTALGIYVCGLLQKFFDQIIASNMVQENDRIWLSLPRE